MDTGLQLGEAEVNADRAKEFVPAPRRVSHAVQSAVELIGVFLFRLASSRLRVDELELLCMNLVRCRC